MSNEAGTLQQSSFTGQQDLLDPVLLPQLRKTIVSVTEPWWQGEMVSANGLIYGLNLSGARPPLFWCFQGYDEFAALARGLGPDQPLYGMRSGNLVLPATAGNEFHMALNYAQEIHSLGLKGPLILGGNCQGSQMAQKMAQILIAASVPVSLFVCLNPYLFSPYPGRTAVIVGQYDVTNPFHRFHKAAALLRANIPQATVDILPSEHGKVFSGGALAQLCEVVRRRMDEAAGTYPGGFPLWFRQAEISAPSELTMAAGSLAEVPVVVRNTSEDEWGPSSQSGLSAGNHWRNTDQSILQWLDGSQSFDAPLMPGEAVELSLLVRAPDKAGDYLLEIDVEHAGVLWLGETGVKTAVCKALVTPAE
jgi:hypothetical protein